MPTGRDSPIASSLRFLAARPDATALLVILGLGLCLRLALLVGAPVFVHGDSYQYYRPAAGLLTGEGFPLPLKRPPAYPVFLALVGWGLGEDPRILAAVQHGLGLATAALTYGIGRLAIGRVAGVLAGLAVALSGGLLIYEQYVLTESLFTFLLALGVYLYLLGLQGGAIGYYLGTGLAIGLATLTRVHAQVLVLAIPCIVLLSYRRWCRPVRGTALAVLAAAVVIVPWTIRNGVVHGDFTVAARSGQSLIYLTLVHHPGRFVFYDRDNPPQDDDPKLERARKYIQQRADEKIRNPSANVLGITMHAWLMKNLDLDEGEANAIMRDVALDAIRARPLTYLQVVAEEARELFFGRSERLAEHLDAHRRTLRDGDNPPPRRLRALVGPATPEQEQHLALTELAVGLYQSPRFDPLLPLLFLVGLAAALAVPAYRMLLPPGMAVLLLHGVTLAVVGFGERYRYPTEPLVHVVAIGGALFLVRLVVGRRWFGAEAFAPTVGPRRPSTP